MLVEWLERRESAWRWLLEFPRSHRESTLGERQEFDRRSRAFCASEDAILTELRQRGEPFVYQGQRFAADSNGLVIQTVARSDAQTQSEAKGGAA